MATMYRPKSGQETDGEKLLYDKFKSMLPDDYLVWHNQIPPQKDREIDFLVLHPTFGLWVIEVKDWVVDQLIEVDTDTVVLEKRGIFGLGRQTKERNPLRQARENRIALKEAFQKHKVLTHADGPHLGKLLVPLNSFAVMTNISRDDLNRAELSEIMAANRVWTKDFVTDEYASDGDWEKKLLDTRETKFQCRLDLGQINAIKRCIGVAVVVAPGFNKNASSEGVGTLDEHQSQLVEQSIDQQVTIEGPAGSGKSIVLLKRALHIHNEYVRQRLQDLPFAFKDFPFCLNAPSLYIERNLKPTEPLLRLGYRFLIGTPIMYRISYIWHHFLLPHGGINGMNVTRPKSISAKKHKADSPA